MVHKTQNKSYTTFSRHRDRLESLFVEVCFVCVSVFVYTIVIGLIQKLTEVLIDILNTNIKVWVTKYKLFIFMATTQLESGSFMVGMNHDCKSASMNRPLCAPRPVCEKPFPPPCPREKRIYTSSSPLELWLDLWTFTVLHIFSFVAVFAPSTLISSRRTCNRRLSHFPAITNSLAASLVSGLYLARKGMIQG